MNEVARLSVLQANSTTHGRQVDRRLLDAAAEHILVLEGRD